MEVGMSKIPVFSVRIAFQHPLLQMWYLVKAVHVQLSNEGGKILVFEPPTKDFSGKAFVV